jgi:hypothetical protein
MSNGRPLVIATIGAHRDEDTLKLFCHPPLRALELTMGE